MANTKFGFNGNIFADVGLNIADFVFADLPTLRGSTHGVIVRVLDDGRVVWRPDGVESELTGLPESLLPDFPSL